MVGALMYWRVPREELVGSRFIRPTHCEEMNEGKGSEFPFVHLIWKFGKQKISNWRNEACLGFGGSGATALHKSSIFLCLLMSSRRDGRNEKICINETGSFVTWVNGCYWFHPFANLVWTNFQRLHCFMLTNQFISLLSFQDFANNTVLIKVYNKVSINKL